jgi:peptide/nickel transport system substrate-binding protein
MKSLACVLSAVVLGCAVMAAPAAAQKAKDTVRVPLSEPVAVVSSYFNLGRENSQFFARQIYNTLVYFDQSKGEFHPLLAKSWKRTSPTEIEFELRNDVKFHNGNTFDADDVVYTMKWITDPKTKIQLPYSFSWIANAEKLGSHKVRITSKEPFAPDMLVLATQASIVDAETHGKFAEKIDHDRSPVGTGAFKIAQLDSNSGVLAVRNDAFAHGPDFMKAKVAAVHGIPIPDRDTQIAHLVTGGIDVLPDASVDQIAQYSSDPRFKVTSLRSLVLSILQFDTLNRSGRKELQDPRVRRALVMAIDRDAIVQSLVPGGSNAQKMDALCFREMLGCDYGVLPPKFDPVAAKALLTEAGYPNGFDLELTSRPATRTAATAVAGYWRKVGVNTTVDNVTITVFRKKQRGGELQSYLGERPYGMEDASYALNVLVGSDARTYWDDPVLDEASQTGASERDPEKRKAIYRKAFDRINDQAYLLPFSSMPQTLIHSSELEVAASSARQFDFNVTVFKWK